MTPRREASPAALTVRLTPEQRKAFRHARTSRGYPVTAARPVVAPSTVLAIENGTSAHRVLTLCTLARAWDMSPHTLEQAGLPGIARSLRAGPPPRHPRRPVSPTGPGDRLPPPGITDSIRQAVTARGESLHAARAVAENLAHGLSKTECKALCAFISDVSAALTTVMINRPTG